MFGVPGTLHSTNASGRHASLPKVVDQPQPRLCYPLLSLLQLNFGRSFAVSSLLFRYIELMLPSAWDIIIGGSYGSSI
jgi:hypothetical protein